MSVRSRAAIHISCVKRTSYSNIELTTTSEKEKSFLKYSRIWLTVASKAMFFSRFLKPKSFYPKTQIRLYRFEQWEMELELIILTRSSEYWNYLVNFMVAFMIHFAGIYYSYSVSNNEKITDWFLKDTKLAMRSKITRQICAKFYLGHQRHLTLFPYMPGRLIKTPCLLPIASCCFFLLSINAALSNEKFRWAKNPFGEASVLR